MGRGRLRQQALQAGIVGYFDASGIQLTAEGAALRMWFDGAGAGLKLTGDPEFAFEIAGADEQYVAADVKVEGATVLVFAAAVTETVFVRYAYRDVAPDALYSIAGVPVAPVRARLGRP